MSALARGGLAIVKDPVRRAMLEEAAALGDFLAERMPQVLDDWRAIRAKLGRLPAAQGTATASAAPGRTRPRTRHRRLAPPENIRRSSPQPDGARVITNPDQAAHGAG
jgi:hypothetical protein